MVQKVFRASPHLGRSRSGEPGRASLDHLASSSHDKHSQVSAYLPEKQNISLQPFYVDVFSLPGQSWFSFCASESDDPPSRWMISSSASSCCLNSSSWVVEGSPSISASLSSHSRRRRGAEAAVQTLKKEFQHLACSFSLIMRPDLVYNISRELGSIDKREVVADLLLRVTWPTTSQQPPVLPHLTSPSGP